MEVMTQSLKLYSNPPLFIDVISSREYPTLWSLKRRQKRYTRGSSFRRKTFGPSRGVVLDRYDRRNLRLRSLNTFLFKQQIRRVRP